VRGTGLSFPLPVAGRGSKGSPTNSSSNTWRRICAKNAIATSFRNGTLPSGPTQGASATGTRATSPGAGRAASARAAAQQRHAGQAAGQGRIRRAAPVKSAGPVNIQAGDELIKRGVKAVIAGQSSNGGQCDIVTAIGGKARRAKVLTHLRSMMAGSAGAPARLQSRRSDDDAESLDTHGGGYPVDPGIVGEGGRGT
jgi:hypothetical protein